MESIYILRLMVKRLTIIDITYIPYIIRSLSLVETQHKNEVGNDV